VAIYTADPAPPGRHNVFAGEAAQSHNNGWGIIAQHCPTIFVSSIYAYEQGETYGANATIGAMDIFLSNGMIFYAKLDSSGTPVFFKNTGPTNVADIYIELNALAVSSGRNKLYVGGAYFGAPFIFNNQTIPPAFYDGYIFEADASNGEPEWIDTYPGPDGGTDVNGIGINQLGFPVVGGSASSETVGGTAVDGGMVVQYYIPTEAPTTSPTFAPPPPDVPIELLQQDVVCGPEISLVRRQLASAADGRHDRALLQEYTPQTCYEVRAMHAHDSHSFSFFVPSRARTTTRLPPPRSPDLKITTGLPRPPRALAGRFCLEPVLRERRAGLHLLHPVRGRALCVGVRKMGNRKTGSTSRNPNLLTQSPPP
jgi:hypothetical protein